MKALPPRYEALHRLGQGGGGEVWAVRDRVLGTECALKVLADGAGELELASLVREAAALSGLEGLGVPRVLAFGRLDDGRRYLVRELVEGRSLEEIFDESKWSEARAWIEPIADAADQLTSLHRAGLLHGDVKPANVIVGSDRQGTLVDLGLAAPWREGGTEARGLTPKYAAPELLEGGPLTVRAEVYALAATLDEGLARRGGDLPDDEKIALAKVAMRGKDLDPQKRFPSTSELSSALRIAARLPPAKERNATPWPVLGIDSIAHEIVSAIRALGPGEGLALLGERGAGRSTLLRRVAWTLGIEDRSVVLADVPRTDLSREEAIALEMGVSSDKTLLAIDDADSLDHAAKKCVRDGSRAGARVVVVGSEATASACAIGKVQSIAIPPLAIDVTDDLLQRAMPSLPTALARHLAERALGRPGQLRNAVRALAGRAIVSEADIDEALDEVAEDEAEGGLRAQNESAEEVLARAERLLAIGRIGIAESALVRFDFTGSSRENRERAAIIEARLRTARGEASLALDVLDREKPTARSKSIRAWNVARSRALLRAGRFEDAKLAAAAVEGDDALAGEALTARGVAEAYLGEDALARKSLEEALKIARATNDERAEGFALGSLGIVHQRASRVEEARAAYVSALAFAERSRDATTAAATRLNLAGIAREEGDIRGALEQLEATVDLGGRAGGLLAVQQARMNLVNLDLYLGRHARARAAIDEMRENQAALPEVTRAQLLGCRAELAARSGEIDAAATLYEACALAYEKQGRASDAAEARLEALFMRSGRNPPPSLIEVETVSKMAEGHRALALLVRGVIEARQGHDEKAKLALDEAVEVAKQTGQQERAVWALAARSRVAASQGSRIQAQRDVEAALAMLEQTASTLPRDLREVFWDEPRRAVLRSATNATAPSMRNPPKNMWNPTLSSFSIAKPIEDKLGRVLEIVRELATERDLPRLLSKVTDHAIALLGGERGFLVLENDEGALEAHASRDREGDDPHAIFSRSVAEKVMATGEPVVALRAREDARLAEAVSVHQLAIQSIACVPVHGPPPLGRPIGALYVETRVRPGSRFADELPLLSAFADQAAIAIENARLTSELAERNAELEAAQDKLEGRLDRRTEQLAEARRDLSLARKNLRGHFGYGGLVGTSGAMRRLYALLDRIKDADVPALVTGESGTGKEVVARAIHDASARKKKTFTGINCGAIPENLLESELFGHVRGAFTGADRDRKGLLRETEGGTLLLDEIGEMPLKMQASLLRVLQEKMVRPIGGANEEPVDVRIIAATNRDLESLVKEGSFREDLYYRLHVVEIRVPPLRERSEDIPPLIDHFLTLFSTRHRREKKTIGRDALARLTIFDWPGNVRQLEHVLLNAWLMSENHELSVADLQLPETRPTRETDSRPRSSPRPARNETEYRDSEKERILRALAACNWNRVKAAELTGIPRRTFYRRLKEFGIL